MWRSFMTVFVLVMGSVLLKYLVDPDLRAATQQRLNRLRGDLGRGGGR